MARNRISHRGALGLALAIAIQGALLCRMDRMTAGQVAQCMSVSLLLAGAVYELWRNRMRIDHRVDMLLTMLAFGGLGMLIGTGVDHALAREPVAVHGEMPAVPADPHADHAGMGHGSMQHATAGHGGGLSWGSFWKAVFSWMNGLMLVGGIVPSLWMTRCASLARQSRRRWVATHLAGNVGMVVVMILGGKLLGHALGMRMGLAVTGHHLAMVGGMLIGMEAAQFAAEAALGLRPWSSIRGESPMPNRDESKQAPVQF